MKDELKPGRIAVLRSGAICIIDSMLLFVNIKTGTRETNTHNLDSELRSPAHEQDVMAIYQNMFEAVFENGILKTTERTPYAMWKRSEKVPEYTMPELAEIIGHKFKIKE